MMKHTWSPQVHRFEFEELGAGKGFLFAEFLSFHSSITRVSMTCEVYNLTADYCFRCIPTTTSIPSRIYAELLQILNSSAHLSTIFMPGRC